MCGWGLLHVPGKLFIISTSLTSLLIRFVAVGNRSRAAYGDFPILSPTPTNYPSQYPFHSNPLMASLPKSFYPHFLWALVKVHSARYRHLYIFLFGESRPTQLHSVWDSNRFRPPNLNARRKYPMEIQPPANFKLMALQTIHLYCPPVFRECHSFFATSNVPSS